ncbi:MAG TPA: copper chaperone PCu(A)C [Anaerolineales bacterium]|nr:copper chaperone PCu(A)C [Anaerolineales bacterium]
MNRILVFTLLIVLLLSGCATPAAASVEVQDAWMRPAVQGGNGAAYFAIRSSAAEELVGVSSDVAEAVEMHESKMIEDVMEMRQVQSVPLGAGEEVMFEPGGLHVMLVNLKQDLKAGDEIEITLHFKSYQDLPLRVPVQDIPPSEHEH